MHWLDTTLLAFLGIASVLGFATGFFWQVVRLVGLILAVWASLLFQPSAVSFLSTSAMKGADPGVVKAVAYIIISVGVYLGVYLVGRSFHHLLKSAGLDLVDRFLGSLLGITKAGLVLGGACLLRSKVGHPTAKTWYRESTVAPVLARGMEHALALLPEEYSLSVMPSAESANSL